LSTRMGRGWQSVWGATIYGSLLTVFALSTWYPLSLLVIFAIGVANQVYMTVINTVLLLTVPDTYRGRVLGLYALAWSLVPLGAAVMGALAELTSTPIAVGIGGILVAG